MRDRVHFFGAERLSLDGSPVALEGCDFTFGEEVPVETTILVQGQPSADARPPHVRALVVPWAGVSESTLSVARQWGVPVYNVHHNAPATAELALALLLAVSRRLLSNDASLRKGHWPRRNAEGPPAMLLSGQSAVVYGWGEIGRRVGRALTALDVSVVGVRRQVTEPTGGVVGDDQLEQVLAGASLLVVCSPLTIETRGRIGRRQIELMRPPRVLVNVGRGPIVDEGDFYEALADGTLFGAGVDCWYQYPRDGTTPQLPSRLPFHELENLVMSPHCGGFATGLEELRVSAVLQVLHGLVNGPQPRPVSLDLGY